MTSLVIPYRGGQSDREMAFKFTCERLSAMLDLEPIVSDSGHETFNRAASRNRGVERADSGTVVICDADTIPRQRGLNEAIDASSDGRLHLPFSVFLSLTSVHTDRVLLNRASLREFKAEFVVTSAVGGCLVIDRDAYLSVLQDEEFEGWGGEDVAFKFACDTLLGETVRHEGRMFGLWHPSEMKQESDQYQQNIARQQKYRAALHDRVAMRKLNGKFETQN